MKEMEKVVDYHREVTGGDCWVGEDEERVGLVMGKEALVFEVRSWQLKGIVSSEGIEQIGFDKRGNLVTCIKIVRFLCTTPKPKSSNPSVFLWDLCPASPSSPPPLFSPP